MKQRIPLAILFLAALTLGLIIAWVDSRPTWDDTGITVLAMLLSTACFGFLKPKYAILWAILIGVWIPLIAILQNGNYPSLLAMVFAFFGSYLGVLGQKLMPHQPELINASE